MARAQAVGTLTTLAQNTTTSGQEFAASLVQGSDGNFYGTASDGGVNTNSHGTVFRITPTGAVTNLYSFSGPDGLSPQAGLLLASDGNFYGTTSGGGTRGSGTLFQMTPAGVMTTLYSFGNGYEGAEVDAGVVQGSDGNFYGTTRLGGNGAGTVFQVTPAGGYMTLYSFPSLGTNAGADPLAALVQGSDGNFYGTTETNGMNGAGTVFEVISEFPLLPTREF